jgi:hypothetical protein
VVETQEKSIKSKGPKNCLCCSYGIVMALVGNVGGGVGDGCHGTAIVVVVVVVG